MSFLRSPDGRLRAVWRFALSVVVVFVANFLAAALAMHFGRPGVRRFDIVYRPLTVAFLLGGFMGLLQFADRVREPLAAMGLGRARGWLRETLVGLAVGGAMVAVAVGLIAIVGSLDVVAVVNGRALMLAAAEIVVLIFGALAEELMFRGYPFQRLVEAGGAVTAVLVLSVLFGLVHLGNPHASVWGLVNTVLVGILLSLAYLRTRRLWMPWGIHFAWNFTLGMLFGLPVSGLTEFAVLVHGRADGPTWLTGGSYGIEASATAALVIVLGTVALIAWVKPVTVPPEQVPQERADVLT